MASTEVINSSFNFETPADGLILARIIDHTPDRRITGAAITGQDPVIMAYTSGTDFALRLLSSIRKPTCSIFSAATMFLKSSSFGCHTLTSIHHLATVFSDYAQYYKFHEMQPVRG